MLDATSSPAGTAGFLNAFVSRLSRISDRVNAISDLIEKEHEINEDRFAQLNYLRIRTLALKIAVLLGTSAVVFTCLAIISLLGGAIGRGGFREHVLYWLFSGAVVSLGLALIAFLFEMIAASQSMLRQIARDQRTRRSLTVEPRDA